MKYILLLLAAALISCAQKDVEQTQESPSPSPTPSATPQFYDDSSEGSVDMVPVKKAVKKKTTKARKKKGKHK